MANKDSIFGFNARVDLRESEVEALRSQTKKDIALYIQEVATALVRAQAGGGLMVPERDIQEIEKATGENISSAKDIIACALAGKGRTGGQMTVQVQIDPALEEPVKQQAEAMGWTPDELLTNAVNWTIQNGYAYSLTPDNGACIPLSGEDHKELCDFFGKNVVWGSDIVAAVRKARIMAQGKVAA